MADLKISQLTGASTPLAGTEVLPIVQSGATVQVSVANLTAGRTIAGSKLDIKQLTGNWYDGVKVIRASIDSQSLALGNTSGASWIASVDSAGGSNNQLLFGKSTNGTTFIETARFDGSDNFKINTGNIIQGTAAKGVNFTANTPAAGMTSQLLNWYEEGTFTPTLSGGTTTTYTTQMGRYTRIGRLVSFQCEIEINSVGNGSTTIALLGSLPTAAVFSTISVGFFNAVATSIVSLTGYIGAAGGNSVQFQSLSAAGTNSTANAIFQNGARVIFSGQYSV